MEQYQTLNVKSLVTDLYLLLKGSCQKKAFKSHYCKPSRVIKICERCFLCRSIEFCPECHQCPSCCSRSTCRGQIAPISGNEGNLRGRPQGHKNSQRSLPFWIRTNFDIDLRSLQNELESLRQRKIRTLVLRSKVQYYEEGEKPTKFFCNIEKRNFSSKSILKLNFKGQLMYYQKDILKEIRSFYSDLYSSKCSNSTNLMQTCS